MDLTENPRNRADNFSTFKNSTLFYPYLSLVNQETIDGIRKILAQSKTHEAIAQLEGLLMSWETSQQIERKTEHIADLYQANRLLLAHNAHQNQLIKTGFTEFDALFGGFALGENVVIGGRPSMGKTQLLVNLAGNMAKKWPVLFLSYDLSLAWLTYRFISLFTGIAMNKIVQQDLTEAERKLIQNSKEQFDALKLFVNDSCSNNLFSFRELCKKQIEENGIKVIVIDYLQLMSLSKHYGNRENEISKIYRELKNIARDFNVCVIASSQLSRALELKDSNKIPKLTDLRDSGAIEQDADKVIWIYRPEYYHFYEFEDGSQTKNYALMIMAKNKNGPLGSVRIRRDDSFTKFSDDEPSTMDFTFAPDRINEIN